MQHYKSLISHARLFFLSWILFLVFGLTILSVYSTSEIHLAVNSRYNSFLDFIMPYITLIGDGWTITIFCVLVFAWNRRAGLVVGIATLLPSMIIQGLKMTLFYGEPRPKWYFTYIDKVDIHYVPGVENWLYDSFPSGHTTASFAFFLALSFCLEKRWLSILCFTVALAVGFSRIYLSQHFLADVVAGSAFGVFFSTLVVAESVRFKLIQLPLPYPFRAKR
jgi:membrane-associated phospholipid phosphatase